jgi:hypothetical protein
MNLNLTIGLERLILMDKVLRIRPMIVTMAPWWAPAVGV